MSAARTRRERFLVAFTLTMKRLSQIVAVIGVILGVLGSARVFADEKATSMADARAAVEANLKTPEGKAYDERLAKEFTEKHLSTMRQCKQTAGNDLVSFWILMKLDKDGAVKEVLLHPSTKMGICARETLLKSTFSPPPRAAYWVSVYMKLVH